MNQFDQAINEILEEDTSDKPFKTLETMKSLIKDYFADELQRDETPIAAKKRKEIKNQLMKLARA